MLTYTFSPREKMMLAILAFVGILIAWYQFVFVNYQNQMSSLDSQIATVQEEILLNQSRAEAIKKMQTLVEEYEAQGIDPLILPSYDNTKSLMAYLNGVLASSTGYSMAFDNASVSEEDGMVHRTGTISFGADSYKSARSIAEAIARGPYPCQVTALGITDDSSQGTKRKESEGTVTASLEVTFLEEVPEGTTVKSEEDGGVQGQDLSKLSDWDK
ncbi:MAG: hypothetical protein Q4A07_05770 [Coriobacteriales bacterium]|nr:hypothetical protein [Coriobacteriales bacterium]